MIIKKTSDSKEPLNFQYIDCSGNAQTPNRLHRYIQTTEKSRLKGKRLPVLFDNKQDCCGCSACFAVCPMSGDNRPAGARSQEGKSLSIVVKSGQSNIKMQVRHTGAITMMPDEQGFLYPTVDMSVCIGCLKCESVCTFKK